MNPYMVVSASDSVDLEDQVNHMITQGYGVYGPCVVFFDELIQPLMQMPMVEIPRQIEH
jgi:hypothetical protein